MRPLSYGTPISECHPRKKGSKNREMAAAVK